MIDLESLGRGWFDRIYSSDGMRPTLENKAIMLRSLEVNYTERQIRDFREAISQGLHLMQKDCKPSLVVTVYSLITALSMSDNVLFSEIEKYIEAYRAAVERKCPDIQQNFE
jgi:hypothetical protein